MSQWIEQLNNRKLYLNNLIAILEKNLQGVPEGKLRVSNNKGIPRYYWIKSSTDTCGKYIAQKDRELIEKLAQKDYMKKLYAAVLEEYEDVNKYLVNLDMWFLKSSQKFFLIFKRYSPRDSIASLQNDSVAR